MQRDKQKALEAAGWKFGDAADFLAMTDEERQMLDLKGLAQFQKSIFSEKVNRMPVFQHYRCAHLIRPFVVKKNRRTECANRFGRFPKRAGYERPQFVGLTRVIQIAI